MNFEQLWETTMNPKTRTLIQVLIEDEGEAEKGFHINGKSSNAAP